MTKHPWKWTIRPGFKCLGLVLVFGVLLGSSSDLVLNAEEDHWSGMLIVDSSIPLHLESSREAIPLPYPLILYVDPGSEAFKKGFRGGDFIVGPPEREILSMQTLSEVLKSSPEALRIRNKDGRNVLRFVPTKLSSEGKNLLAMQNLLFDSGRNPPDSGKMIELAGNTPNYPPAEFLAAYSAIRNGDEKNAEGWLGKLAESNTDQFLGAVAVRIAPLDLRSGLQSAVSRLEQAAQIAAKAETPESKHQGGKTAALVTPDLGPSEKAGVQEVSLNLSMSGATIDESIESLREAHLKNPNDGKIREKLIFALLKKVNANQKRPVEELEIYLREAYELAPDNFYVNHLWGSILLARENFEPAASRLEVCVSVQPENLDSNRKLGYSLMKMMKYDDALPPFERALKQAPKDFFLLYFIGRCQYELKEFDRAVEVWEDALPLASNPNDARQLQGLISQAKEQQASIEGSTKDENARFIIHFAGDSQKDIGDVTMEFLEEIYDQVTSDLMFKPEIKINVLFFRTDDFYQVNQVQKWVGGMAQGAKILVPLRAGYSDMGHVKETLGHEFTHVIVNLRTNQNCPTWIHEGLAMMQGFKAGFGDYTTMRGDFEKLYEKRVVEEKNVKPIAAINFSAKSEGSPEIKEAYLASYLAMRFLVDRWGWQGVDDLLQALGQGSHIENALEKAINRNYRDFQKELDDWISTQ